MKQCAVAPEARAATQFVRRFLSSLVLGLLVACSGQTEPATAHGRADVPPAPENQFRLRQALASPPGTNRGQLQSGEDCEAGGRAACLGGVCLHVGRRPDEHFVCATACLSDDDCPDAWRCVPEGRQMYCAPPAGFRPHAVAARVAQQRPTPPAARVLDAGVITCRPDGGVCR